jgi:hypothetical protein
MSETIRRAALAPNTLEINQVRALDHRVAGR